MGLSRLVHFGPLIALAIIKCVSFTTLHYFSMWCFPSRDWLSCAMHSFYYLLIALTSYNFLFAIFVGPGYVPKGWRPEKKEDEQYLQYCKQCDGFKAPRSHHCSKCGRCILKMDHHCPWINNCAGYRNQRHFFYFLLFAVIGSIYSIYLLGVSLYRAFTGAPNMYGRYIHLSMTGFFFILFSIGMAAGVIIAVGSLLVLQFKILITNKTSIEDWIIKKANARERDEKFVYPYDLGKWNNLKHGLWYPQGDGTTWPVLEGCDQYTLTYEQLQQKKDKERYTQLYQIVKPYNGNFFPLFSQGCCVCVSFPLNDNPRLVVAPGDRVMVNHCNKRWLYGYKVLDNSQAYPPKGWFPQQCAVPLVAANQTNHNHDDSDNKKTK